MISKVGGDPIVQDGTVEQRIIAISAEFMCQLVALRGSKLSGGSRLKADLGSVLQPPKVLNPQQFFKRVQEMLGKGQFRLLDLGCGDGPHRRFIQQAGYEWVGCDWDGSVDPKALARAGSELDGKVIKYGGLKLPFQDKFFDTVWSYQSLEHVRHPEITIAEVSRCLRKDGLFAGSASFLEPYHAQSTFGYTPYGFQIICERHGIELLTIQPAQDVLALFVKKIVQMLGVAVDGAKLHLALMNADLMSPLRDAFESKNADELASVFGQICGTFRFIGRKQ